MSQSSRLLLLAVTICVISSPAFGADRTTSLQVKSFDLVPHSTKRGIPVSLRLVVSNHSATWKALPAYAVLSVRTSDGTQFYASIGAGSIAGMEWADDRLAPGETRAFEISTDGSFFRPIWFGDTRLHNPGTYLLDLLLSDSYSEEGPQGDRNQMAQLRATAVLTVEEPSGIDAEVWQLMQAFGGGTWQPSGLITRRGEELGDTILSQYSGSVYAGWFAATGTASDLEERANQLRRWLGEERSDALRPVRELRLVDFDVALMNKFSLTRPEKSKEYEQRARATLLKLSETKQSDAVRSRIREWLEYLDDR
jgi:hypothetical protein